MHYEQGNIMSQLYAQCNTVHFVRTAAVLTTSMRFGTHLKRHAENVAPEVPSGARGDVVPHMLVSLNVPVLLSKLELQLSFPEGTCKLFRTTPRKNLQAQWY